MKKIKGEKEYIEGLGKTDIYRTEHFQGIAQAGPYTILSSDMKKHNIMVADRSLGKRLKYQKSYSLPDGYDHAGGIDVIKDQNQNGKWCIAVPAYGKNKTGAVFLYHLTHISQPGLRFRVTRTLVPVVTILEEKAYAAGIARIQLRDSFRVVLAVVCDPDGKKVEFFESVNSMLGPYQRIGVWNPTKNWAGYPNSISLVSHQNCLYLIGLKGVPPRWLHWWIVSEITTGIGWLKNTADLYQVNIANGLVDLKKEAHWKFRCKYSVSFRWGGNARVVNNRGKIDVLACERNLRHGGRLCINRFDVE